MTDRVILRSGSGTSPPGFLRPGELAYSPSDNQLWLADGAGTAHPVASGGGGGGGGSGLTSFMGRITAAAVLIGADVSSALGYTPSAFDGAYSSLTGKPTLFDGTWTSLTGKPSFATVATSGAYADLTGKPALFDGTYASLTGKPTLFDGAYASLTGKPTLGGAAALNVGTTTGTVAAGDDPRLSGGGGVTLGSATPTTAGTAAAGTAIYASHEDHIHGTDTSRAPLAAPAFTGQATLTDTATSGIPFTVTNTANTTSGVQIKLVGNGGSNPSKIIRVVNGTFQIRNDADSATIFSLSNAGLCQGVSSLILAGSLTGVTSITAAGAITGVTNLTASGTITANGVDLSAPAYTAITGRPKGSATLAFGAGGNVVADTWRVDIPYGATLADMIGNVGSAGGSFTVNVAVVGGSAVTGWNGSVVNSSSDQTFTATANNTVGSSGGQIDVTVTSITGSPVGGRVFLRWSH